MNFVFLIAIAFICMGKAHALPLCSVLEAETFNNNGPDYHSTLWRRLPILSLPPEYWNTAGISFSGTFEQ